MYSKSLIALFHLTNILDIKQYLANGICLVLSITVCPVLLVSHLALFSSRTESDNPDATCELSP